MTTPSSLQNDKPRLGEYQISCSKLTGTNLSPIPLQSIRLLKSNLFDYMPLPRCGTRTYDLFSLSIYSDHIAC